MRPVDQRALALHLPTRAFRAGDAAGDGPSTLRCLREGGASARLQQILNQR